MTENKETKGVRIAKIIANAGFCSRREAEELIEQSRVQVNGKVITDKATIITDQSIKIDNKLLNQKQETRIFIFYKPAGVITSNKDEKGRKTVFDFLSNHKLPRLITVGRLDFNTEGLLLLTTNGEVSRYIELPKNAWIRKYRARVYGRIDEQRLQKLEKGITVNGVKYGSIKVDVEPQTNNSKSSAKEKQSQNSANSWLQISISEGKNREIRKVMEEVGLQVNRLIRTSFGPFSLGTMKEGQIIEVDKKTLKNYLPKEFL